MIDADHSGALLRVMRRVRSVREFRPDPVPDPVLTDILDVARWTGSGMNRQLWTFVVIRERADFTPPAGFTTPPPT
jgi:nitroreductase